MTEKQLKSILDRLNNGKLSEQMFMKPLGPNVYLGYYWNQKPKPTISISSGGGPYQFYLIKNEDEKFVGCVLDMTTDLHWYVLPAYRKNGYLSNALRKVILPYLFESRKEQRITINSHQLSDKHTEASEGVAERLGFKAIGGMEYLLEKRAFKPIKLKVEETLGMEDERLEVLRKRTNYISKSLWQIANETETSLGKSKYSEGLLRLVEEIRKYTWKLEDAQWDFKNSKEL